MVMNPAKESLNAAQEAFLFQFARYFLDRGWSLFAVFGLAANVYAECRFNPKDIGDGGKAIGIGQWQPPRQKNFFDLFKERLTTSTAIDKQMAFMHHELTKGTERRAGNSLKGAMSAREAGAIVSREYERPAQREAEAKARGDFAEKLYALYARKIDPSIPAPKGP